MAKVILINGAPRSGKDTAAKLIAALDPIKTVKLKMATVLKNATHALYGLRNVEADHFEDNKDTSIPILNGMSPREAYISMSEELVKPVYGTDFFGKVIAQRVNGDFIYTVSDAGFYEECMPIIDKIGADNVLLLHIVRDGCDYSGDSRSDIFLKSVKTERIANNKSEEHFEEVLTHIVNKWLGECDERESKSV